MKQWPVYRFSVSPHWEAQKPHVHVWGASQWACGTQPQASSSRRIKLSSSGRRASKPIFMTDSGHRRPSCIAHARLKRRLERSSWKRRVYILLASRNSYFQCGEART